MPYGIGQLHTGEWPHRQENFSLETVAHFTLACSNVMNIIKGWSCRSSIKEQAMASIWHMSTYIRGYIMWLCKLVTSRWLTKRRDSGRTKEVTEQKKNQNLTSRDEIVFNFPWWVGLINATAHPQWWTYISPYNCQHVRHKVSMLDSCHSLDTTGLFNTFLTRFVTWGIQSRLLLIYPGKHSSYIGFERCGPWCRRRSPSSWRRFFKQYRPNSFLI